MKPAVSATAGEACRFAEIERWRWRSMPANASAVRHIVPGPSVDSASLPCGRSTHRFGEDASRIAPLHRQGWTTKVEGPVAEERGFNVGDAGWRCRCRLLPWRQQSQPRAGLRAIGQRRSASRASAAAHVEDIGRRWGADGGGQCVEQGAADLAATAAAGGIVGRRRLLREGGADAVLLESGFMAKLRNVVNRSGAEMKRACAQPANARGGRRASRVASVSRRRQTASAGSWSRAAAASAASFRRAGRAVGLNE